MRRVILYILLYIGLYALEYYNERDLIYSYRMLMSSVQFSLSYIGHGRCEEDGTTTMNVTWRDTGTAVSKMASKRRQFSLAFKVTSRGSSDNATWGLESIVLRFNDSLGG